MTAKRRFAAGKIPGARKLPNGHIEIDPGPDDCGGACLSGLHPDCLARALQDAGYTLDGTLDAERIAQALRDAGYRIERDEPEP